MDNVPLMLKDDRPIQAVWLPNDGGYIVGQMGVTRIVLYEETGEMAMVTWFAVYQDDHLMVRIPARAIEQVVYQPTGATDEQ